VAFHNVDDSLVFFNFSSEETFFRERLWQIANGTWSTAVLKISAQMSLNISDIPLRRKEDPGQRTGVTVEDFVGAVSELGRQPLFAATTPFTNC
jgi:hypothetical protein